MTEARISAKYKNVFLRYLATKQVNRIAKRATTTEFTTFTDTDHAYWGSIEVFFIHTKF